MNVTNALLTGIILTSSLISSVFFAKFWRITRDGVFLAFAFAFAIEGSTRLVALYFTIPTEGLPAFYGARLIGYLAIIIAVVRKNSRS